MYDIISPPYGRVGTLEKLFSLLGYVRTGPTFHTQGRRVVILGNVVPFAAAEEILRRMYDLLAPMTEQGSVIILLGPVELHTLIASSSSSGLLNEINQWRCTFPLWIEGNGFRATYGAWLDSEIRILNSTLVGRRLQPERIALLTREGQRTSEALQRILTYTDPATLGATTKSYCTEEDPLEFNYPVDAPPLFLGRSYQRSAVLVEGNRCYLPGSLESREPLRAYRWEEGSSLNVSSIVELR